MPSLDKTKSLPRRYPPIDVDHILSHERMASLLDESPAARPSRKEKSRLPLANICWGLGIASLPVLSYSLYRGPISEDLSKPSAQRSVRYNEPRREQYIKSNINLSQILDNNACLTVGEESGLILPISLCFRSCTASKCFTVALQSEILKYQLDNGLSPTGKIDRDTLNLLLSSSVLRIKNNEHHLGLESEFFKIIYDLEDPASRKLLAQTFFGKEFVVHGTNVIEDGLVNNGLFRDFIDATLLDYACSETRDSKFKPNYEHALLIGRALRLGITRPLFLTPKALSQVLDTYEQPNFNGDTVALLVGDDWNGARYGGGLSNLVSYCAENKMNIRIVFFSDDRNVESVSKSVSFGFTDPQQAILTVATYHGKETHLRIGPNDNQQDFIDVNDNTALDELNEKVIANGGVFISAGCSTARGGPTANNLVAKMAQHFTRCSFVIGPEQKCCLTYSAHPENPNDWEKLVLSRGDKTGLYPPLYFRFFDPNKQAELDNEVRAVVIPGNAAKP